MRKRCARPERTPLRVSITGIDGAGKDTVAGLALLECAERYPCVVKLGRPAYRIEGGVKRQIYGRTTAAFDRLHALADERRDPRLILCVNAMHVMAQARILERREVNARPTPDVVATTRDWRIDPAVYFSYYAPSKAGAISIEERMRNMQRLTGVQRDLIILLRVNPIVAVERIEGRMEQEAALRSYDRCVTASDRDKWRHLHETVEDLAALAEGYTDALASLNGDTTTVVEIETTGVPKEVVAHSAAEAIKQAVSEHDELCLV